MFSLDQGGLDGERVAGGIRGASGAAAGGAGLRQCNLPEAMARGHHARPAARAGSSRLFCPADVRMLVL